MKAMKRFVDGLHLNTGDLFLSHVFYSCTISFRTFDWPFLDFQFEALLEFL